MNQVDEILLKHTLFIRNHIQNEGEGESLTIDGISAVFSSLRGEFPRDVDDVQEARLNPQSSTLWLKSKRPSEGSRCTSSEDDGEVLSLYHGKHGENGVHVQVHVHLSTIVPSLGKGFYSNVYPAVISASNDEDEDEDINVAVKIFNKRAPMRKDTTLWSHAHREWIYSCHFAEERVKMCFSADNGMCSVSQILGFGILADKVPFLVFSRAGSDLRYADHIQLNDTPWNTVIRTYMSLILFLQHVNINLNMVHDDLRVGNLLCGSESGLDLMLCDFGSASSPSTSDSDSDEIGIRLCRSRKDDVKGIVKLLIQLLGNGSGCEDGIVESLEAMVGKGRKDLEMDAEMDADMDMRYGKLIEYLRNLIFI